jgi:hypothetical protein
VLALLMLILVLHLTTKNKIKIIKKSILAKLKKLLLSQVARVESEKARLPSMLQPISKIWALKWAFLTQIFMGHLYQLSLTSKAK